MRRAPGIKCICSQIRSLSEAKNPGETAMSALMSYPPSFFEAEKVGQESATKQDVPIVRSNYLLGALVRCFLPQTSTYRTWGNSEIQVFSTGKKTAWEYHDLSQLRFGRCFFVK